ncbi:MAG: hypothetical protein HC808_18280 [Candidatus Competibacteraceae bacterium]|nr:hypothetical protein [Candidatus Competibacteraceae bacterium]
MRRVDQILVLDHERIVASGRQDELVAEDGLFARATLQFREPSQSRGVVIHQLQETS